MLQRKIESKISNWIKNSRNALLVSGARQVGKTYIIRKCLEGNGYPFVEINLIEHPEFVEVINQSANVEDLKINITALLGNELGEGTFIFIDEIQEAKDIVTKIKFWVDEGSYRYILSGSLLGVELYNIRSAPVGYLEEIKMYPMDFEEFARASGVKDDVIDYLRQSYADRKPVGKLLHDTMMKHFRRYLVVGGMPSAVQRYIDTKDISEVSIIQRNIINLYRLDFTKYEKREKKLQLINIYNQIPSQLLKQNRRFNYSDLKKGLRYEYVENSFVWLYSAGVVLPVFNSTEPRVSLNQNVKSSLVKLYYSDVGLLCEQYGGALKSGILLGDDKINVGGIYENVVAQELRCHGFDIYYYNSKKQGELDFVIEKDLSVLPIEVKSGKDYYYHSAISNALKNKEYKIKEACVFTNYDLREEESIVYYPVYMCIFMENEYTYPVLD